MSAVLLQAIIASVSTATAGGGGTPSGDGSPGSGSNNGISYQGFLTHGNIGV